MFEKVNMYHPDKKADRIGGAIVDLAYSLEENPKVAVEVLIGHGVCNIIIESSVNFNKPELQSYINHIVQEISEEKDIKINLKAVAQDKILASNQKNKIRCGDNGIFKGVPITQEEKDLTELAKKITAKYPYDGKYIISDEKLIICQSNAKEEDLKKLCSGIRKKVIINPLGYWTGGVNVDGGAVNRKLGSDMAQSVTGGGIIGKDYSKADVSVNIYCYLKAQETQEIVTAYCAIGDTKLKVVVGDKVNYVPYSDIVKTAKEYIESIGGFEKFAEWGLVR